MTYDSPTMWLPDLPLAILHPLWGSLSVQPDAFEAVRVNMARVPQGL